MNKLRLWFSKLNQFVELFAVWNKFIGFIETAIMMIFTAQA